MKYYMEQIRKQQSLEMRTDLVNFTNAFDRVIKSQLWDIEAFQTTYSYN